MVCSVSTKTALFGFQTESLFHSSASDLNKRITKAWDERFPEGSIQPPSDSLLALPPLASVKEPSNKGDNRTFYYGMNILATGVAMSPAAPLGTTTMSRAFMETQKARAHANGESETPAPQMDRLEMITKGIKELRVHGFSFTRVAGILSQTAVLIQVSLNYFGAISSKGGTTDYIPLQGMLVPIAQLYLKINAIIDLFQEWKKEENSEIGDAKFMQIVGLTALCFMYVGQLITYCSFFHIPELLSLYIHFLLYFASLYDLIFEHHKNNREMEEQLGECRYNPVLIP